jgi:hypothetical protein
MKRERSGGISSKFFLTVLPINFPFSTGSLKYPNPEYPLEFKYIEEKVIGG